MYEAPFAQFFLIYIFILFLVSVRIYMNGATLTAVEFFSKSLFLPLCFYLCSVYFSKESDEKALIVSFVLAVIFPLIFIMFQKITGYTLRYHATRGLIRSQGIYHDAVTARIFIVQALIGIYIYWNYFLNRSRYLMKIALLFLSSLCLVGLYFLYSKAVVLTLVLWIILFAFFRKRMYVLPMAISLLILINSLIGNKLLSDMKTLFSKEIEYAAGNISSDYVLAGRGGIWKSYLIEWKGLPILEKIIGTGRSHGYFHNDFLRILFAGGISYLLLYLGLLFSLSIKMIQKFMRDNKALYFAGLLGITYYFCESLGQLAGFYPILQPATWGLVGLCLNKQFQPVEK
ncbi:hypothetical protein [Candidatus Jordarchaeum sp.]|uniref:hypothetical protein n=1 Tax=Candidatus Jordarchaeum sp. TaxID=2823881 RepID=UPI00404B7E8E